MTGVTCSTPLESVNVGRRAIVALHPIDPVVEAILEVAHRAVRVAHVPAGDQRLADVGLVVAVGVLEADRETAVLADHAAAIERERVGNTQVLGKDGELVHLAVVVRVFADANAVATFAVSLPFVRIVNRFADPQPAAGIPIGSKSASGRNLALMRRARVGSLPES